LIRHKKQLYSFFDDYTEKITDPKIWRLIGRMKTSFMEPVEIIKEIKFKEIRAYMELGWENRIE